MSLSSKATLLWSAKWGVGDMLGCSRKMLELQKYVFIFYKQMCTYRVCMLKNLLLIGVYDTKSLDTTDLNYVRRSHLSSLAAARTKFQCSEN